MEITIKTVIGVVVIAASFVYILKNRSQSMMDALMKKRREDMEKAMSEPEAESAGETLAAGERQSQNAQESPETAEEAAGDSVDLRL